MLVERTLIQPFRSDEMSGMIATLAISVIIQNGAVLLLGPAPRPMPDIVTGHTGDRAVQLSRGRACSSSRRRR